MFGLIGLLIILIIVGYIIEIAAGFLKIPAPLTRLLQLLLALVFIVYLLQMLGMMPAGLTYR